MGDGRVLNGSHEAFRDVMRHFPTGVTVVGAAYNGHKHGMTVNSFTSVSLEPPMVLICITRKSGCHELIEESGMFSISVLSRSRKTAAFIVKPPAWVLCSCGN